MNQIIMFAVVLLPIIGGVLEYLIPFKKRNHMLLFAEAVCVINSVMILFMILGNSEDTFTLFRFSGDLSIRLHLDGPAKLFSGMVAFLWPLAVMYSAEYMKHEEREKSFFMFYIITYGATVGAALSENILTLYFFFEMISLITLPLIMHTRTREAILASRTYLNYMIGGAAFAFIGMVFVLSYGSTSSFVLGGVIDPAKVGDKTNLLLLIYVFSFFGFGMKTAIWPFSAWLPKAGVAPTPVTALLHAVAVVNTGAYAVMRITYYSFGTDLLRGTWAQIAVMIPVIFTIVYGCSRALKETHIKRRLAWSTVSNLSYILFGIVLMTPEGFTGGMCHMLFHSFMKITSFFCAGAIMYKTGKKYIHELDGLGRKMPVTFMIYTAAGLALMGVPGLAGFISKWKLASAAITEGSPLAIAGVVALLISALLTALYMLTVSVRAFFPGKDFDYNTVEGIKDPNFLMLVPLCIFLIVVIYFGLNSGNVIEFISNMSING